MFEKKACYLWIECAKKKFPAQILSNIRGIDFEYSIKLLTFDDLVDFCPCRSLFGCTHDIDFPCQKPIKQLEIDPTPIIKEIIFEDNFPKPNPENCDFEEIGDTVLVRPNARTIERGKDIHFMVIFIVAPKKCRITFSISFSGLKFNQKKEQYCDYQFGKMVRKYLNEPDERYDNKKFFRAVKAVKLVKSIVDVHKEINFEKLSKDKIEENKSKID